MSPLSARGVAVMAGLPAPGWVAKHLALQQLTQQPDQAPAVGWGHLLPPAGRRHGQGRGGTGRIGGVGMTAPPPVVRPWLPAVARRLSPSPAARQPLFSANRSRPANYPSQAHCGWVIST